MLHLDIPTRSDIDRLLAVRDPSCVSLYLKTTPVTKEAQADRIELKNLARAAVDQLRARGTDKGHVSEIEESLDDLVDHDEFWRFQANSLAIFATPERTVTYRLPNALVSMVEVSDRFHIKPLLRTVTFPQSAFVLALAQGSVRLVEVSGDMPAYAVKVDGMPKDVASAVGQPSILGRAPSGRIQGSEGQKVRMRQYARQIDQALRDLLGGRETPLIIAGAPPLDAIFRSVNTYPHLVDQVIAGNPEKLSDAELAQAARGVLDELHRADLKELHDQFAVRSGQHRTTTDIAQAARAATMGAIATLLADIDEIIPGTVDETDGRVTFSKEASASNYGVVDEIARRAWLSGARVLGVRRADVPGGGSLAAILRYAV
ncbi:MAG: hypothetical protein U0575_06935 [Phycisphaerales bacterium]